MKVAEAKRSAESAKPGSFFRSGENTFISDRTAGSHFFGNNAVGTQFIQAKLTIGQPGDKYEQEADAVADKVVQRLSEPATKEVTTQIKTPSVTPVIQAKCATCEQEEKLQKKDEKDTGEEKQQIHLKEMGGSAPVAPPADDDKHLQRKCEHCEQEEKLQKKDEGGNAGMSSEHIEANLSSSKGSGSPLPGVVQANMEHALGADLSNVRIHTGSNAVQMSKELHAQAFTHGSDIYFNSGKYDTQSKGGQHLLAHELTHTIQQGSGTVNRSIQRRCREAIGRPTGCISSSADITDFNVASDRHYRFRVGCDDFLNDGHDDRARLIATIPHMAFRNEVHIHGFASEEGNAEFNERLSCARAQVTASLIELYHPRASGLRYILYSHGATPGGRPDRRAVVIASTPALAPSPPVPPPPIPPPRILRGNRDRIAECQLFCVKQHGGCGSILPFMGPPTAADFASYNADCRPETSYRGGDIIPSAQDCRTQINLEVIPSIMSANGWRNGAAVLREWFSNPAAGGPPDTTTVTMDWILGFSEANTIYQSMLNERVYMNQPAQNALRQLLTRLRIRDGDTFDFNLPITTLDPPFAGSPDYSVNFRAMNAAGVFSSLNDLSATLGNFVFKIMVAGRVSGGTITITSVGVYVIDSFDFIGDQSLGCWNPCSADVGKFFCDGSDGVDVNNAMFRNWRTQNGAGGDFYIYSDIRRIVLPTPVTFPR